MRYANLSNTNISQAVEELTTYLSATTLGKEDRIRTIFAIEEALLNYQAHFGEEIPFVLNCGSKWGKDQFSLVIQGSVYDPFDQEEDPEFPSITQNMMGQFGLFPNWKYAGGSNIISMMMPKVPSSPLKKLGLSILSAIVIYIITRFLPESVSVWLHTYGVTPLIKVFSGTLGAISGPIIFCSIACSICNMGDIGTFGKIGKQTILAMLKATGVITVISSFWLLFIYPPHLGGSAQSTNAFFDIYQMLLDIIPTNFVVSFVDNNPMQIVTLAVALGISLLALQKKSSELVLLMNQFNNVLQYGMENIASYIHIFVFLSVLGLLLAGQASILLEAYMLVVYLVVAIALTLAYCLARAWFKTGVHPMLLLKKMAPTALIAFSTNSSTAALSDNLKCCKNQLGISPNLANFGVPLGQVIYMPAFALLFGVLAFYMYDIYELTVSLTMLIMLFFLCCILSIALPPIPGGALIVVNILFLQLGIPSDGLALAVIFLTIYAFLGTAIDVAYLQIELLCTAKDLNLLDEEILKSK